MIKWADQIKDTPVYQYYGRTCSSHSRFGGWEGAWSAWSVVVWHPDRPSHITMQLEVLEWSIIAPPLHYAFMVVMGLFPGELTCSMHDH
jgi:hypothetical protein